MALGIRAGALLNSRAKCLGRRVESPPAECAERLELAPLSRDHFATISSWFICAREVAVWAGPSSVFPVDDAHLEAMLAETEGRPPRRIARIALLDGEVVGHAQLAIDWRAGTATLERVAVAPRRRGAGLAARFLESSSRKRSATRRWKGSISACFRSTSPRSEPMKL